MCDRHLSPTPLLITRDKDHHFGLDLVLGFDIDLAFVY